MPPTTGQPIPSSATFSAPNPSVPYSLRVFVDSVARATISINGVEVIFTSDFNMDETYVERAVTLQASSVLPGEVRGKPDGSVYLQVETTDEIFDDAVCNAAATFIYENTLQLLEIRAGGTTVWREIHHSRFEDPTEDFRALPYGSVGEVIPDGEGGVLAAWTYSAGWPEHTVEARVTRFAPSGEELYTLPLRGWGHWRWAFQAGEFREWPNKSLVLGDEGMAFGARLRWRRSETIGTAHLISFEVATGALRWTWESPALDLEMVAATAGNGLVAKVRGGDGGQEFLISRCIVGR